MKQKIIFIVPPGVHLLDINGPAHIFYEAREYGAAIDLHFVSLTAANSVISSAGLKFSDLESFHHLTMAKEDFIIVPGIYFSYLTDRDFLKACSPFFEWLRQQHAIGVNICSVCTGTFLLAESGVLKNRSCTTHWKRIKSFKEKYPKIDLKGNRLFVVDDNIFTSAGISSGIDLALYIIELKFSTKLAADVAKEAVIYFRRGESDPQLSIYLQYRNHLDERVHKAQGFIMDNLAGQFNQTDIADHVNMSVRNLTRSFKNATGLTIHAYTEKLRKEKALNLLAEKNKIEMVARECGFKSINQLRKLLKNQQ